MRGKKIWGPRPEYMRYIRQAKHLFPTMLGHIDRRRIYLCGFISRYSRHLAKITGNKNPWSSLIPDYDYAIEFWDPKFDSSSEAEKIYVVAHELFHIPKTGFEVGSREYRRCVKHDVEDFSWMLNVYGVHMEHVDRVLRGEAYLFGKSGKEETRRFPRLPTSKAK